MQGVFVLSSDRQPLDPCHPARARRLLDRGKAAVFRYAPFTIILKERMAAESVTHAHRLKLDPGSRVTGIAVVREETGRVAWAAEVTHRGQLVHAGLIERSSHRRSRRSRKTRYREKRFLNRTRREGWLPPSLQSRVSNLDTWQQRLRRLIPITAISVEKVRFDTQLMQNAEISGVEYQQGTLAGYEAREYLLEKWHRACAYCGVTSVPMQVEHIQPKARGGSNRISNLALACKDCNDAKGLLPIEVFLQDRPEALRRILAQAKAPLKDAAAVNATRWAVHRMLVATGLPVEVGAGGRTKWNRTRLGLPKAHWVDAACVGASTPDALDVNGVQPLQIRATGHGSHQMCRTDKYGFPNRHKKRARGFQGWLTGDLVRAVRSSGKYAGVQVGRIAIRFKPSFLLNGTDVHPKYLTRLQRADGYTYTTRKEEAHSPAS